MHRIFVSYSNSYVEILTLNVMGLTGRAFERWLGHENGTLINGIGVLRKEIPCPWTLPSKHRYILLPPTVVSKSESPKEPELGSFSSEVRALKQPMRDWGAILSHGERSQTMWWWGAQTPSAPEASGLSRMPLWGRWMQPWMQGHTRWMEELWNQRGRLQRRFSTTWCPLNCEKDFCRWH